MAVCALIVLVGLIGGRRLGFQRVDLFRRLARPKQEQTPWGGVVTLCCITVAIALVVSSISDYYTVRVETNTYAPTNINYQPAADSQPLQVRGCTPLTPR